MTTARTLDLLRAGWLALLLALAGCGPGTGGTGTGPIALSYTGGLSSGSSGASFAPAPGDCGLGSCDRVDLTLEDARVEATAGCARFLHEGPWAVDAAGLLVLDGTLETVTAAGTTRVPATLRLQFGSLDLANTSVTVLLSAADGRGLLGPMTLQRNTTAAPAAPACPAR